MSIVRLSALKGAIHGVRPDGAFVHEDYDGRTRLGRTELFAPPSTLGAGFAPMRTGDNDRSWRELLQRGFPRDRSKLHHLVQSLLEPAVADLGSQPVVMMAHGFLFDPRDATSPDPKDSDNPHSRVYHYVLGDEADEVRRHTSGWPVGLGFSADDATGKDGAVIAFGWHSRPGFAASLIHDGQNFYARAYENAELAAWNFLTVVHVADRVLPPGKKIDLFCHSLGSRIVIRMIALAAKHERFDLIDRIDRAIILGGAEYVVEARLMLQRLTDLGLQNSIQFFNFVSRENDVLDKLGENFGPSTFGNANVIGHNGLDVEDPKSLGPYWLDLQIDGRDLQQWMLATHGLKVTGDNPSAVWDHWYYYTDRNNMALYRAILRDRNTWDIPKLRQAGIPDRVSRRRSIFGD